MTDELALRSMCLFSKYGFNDGDVPDTFLDYCDDHQLEYPATGESGWHLLLVDLVDQLLVPLLPAPVEAYRIGTIHNPIRARTVNGQAVDWSAGDAEAAHTFAEVTVYVPFRAIADRLDGLRHP